MIATPRWSDLNEGDLIPSIVKAAVTPRQLVQYAGASGDFNEIHYDVEFAKSTGLKGTIVHGLLKTAMLGQLVTSWAGEGDVKALSVQYRGMDFPGDVITLGGTVAKKYERDGELLVDLTIWTVNQRNEKTTPGKATVSLPA